jgi:hypothetical protein
LVRRVILGKKALPTNRDEESAAVHHDASYEGCVSEGKRGSPIPQFKKITKPDNANEN